MLSRWSGRARWVLAGAIVALAGATVLVRADIAQRRDAFQAEARIAHRLLSQRAAELDAVLATLALLEPASSPAAFQAAVQRLPQLYPQVIAGLHRDTGQQWSDTALAAAEERSRAQPAARRHAVVAAVDTRTGQYAMVLAGARAGFALRIELHRMAAMEGWPLQDAGAVRAVMALGPDAVVLDPGPGVNGAPVGVTAGFIFSKTLATPSQPFELQLQRPTGPAQWPWGWLLGWIAASGLMTTLVAAWWAERQQQLRSAELVRLSQVSRLNVLGEMAAGMAHELNQPLTAILASTQAAQRVLDAANGPIDDEDVVTARQALTLAAAQARRAADVLARLRRLVEQPHARQPCVAVQMHEVATRLLALMQGPLQRQGIGVHLLGEAAPVLADPVALEQIVHNLLANAMQALQESPAHGKAITIHLDTVDGQGRLRVQDNGPGIAEQALPRLFEPFFTLRPGGLGLGLSLSESLAQAMDGRLSAGNVTPHGAQFTLVLPLVPANELS
jgi:signal transduction histidine kinase